MATIEPRLIHLLNEATTPQLTHAGLPPLSSLPLTPPSERPLPPIERDAGPPGPPASGVYPLRILLGDQDAQESSPYHLNRILDDNLDGFDDAMHKKRGRVLPGKDDFLQLPQPVKKQKAAPPGSVMPPIINGLHEPPPHAALFPPIASNNFNENDATQLMMIQEFNHSEERSGHPTSPNTNSNNKNTGKARKRATKPRRKWTEQETNHLLLGVSRHGVGKWTNILEDPDFKFNERTAGDLKDRFRTCCPVELRKPTRSERANAPVAPDSSPKGLDSILHDPSSPGSSNGRATPPSESDGPVKPKKSRAHRKNLEDLQSLGIHAPFKKSLRRERRPFTEQDDREILDGLHRYGPAWTKIQRDPRFHLSARYPTDLRDRVRNKYPSIYQRIEKGTFQSKDGRGRGNNVMEPSITMFIANSLHPSKGSTLEPQLTQGGSREEMLRWPPQTLDVMDHGPSHALEFGDSVASHSLITGEMGISRLLLEDSRLST